MSELTNYIKERITYYEELKKVSVPWSTTSISYMYLLTELQAVLSKIEEIQKEEIAQARGEAIFNDRD